MSKSIRVTLSFNEEARQTLLELANTEHRTMSQIVRDAIELYKKHNPNEN